MTNKRWGIRRLTSRSEGHNLSQFCCQWTRTRQSVFDCFPFPHWGMISCPKSVLRRRPDETYQLNKVEWYDGTHEDQKDSSDEAEKESWNSCRGRHRYSRVSMKWVLRENVVKKMQNSLLILNCTMEVGGIRRTRRTWMLDRGDFIGSKCSNRAMT